MSDSTDLHELLGLANNYPSPHNGQPMVLVGTDRPEILQLKFDTTRGLTSSTISFLFSFVTIGVFVRHLEMCGEALGHQISIELNLPDQARMNSGELLDCGTVTVAFNTRQPNEILKNAIITRQTSRKKYTTPLTAEEKEQLHILNTTQGFDLEFLDDYAGHQTIWLNQRAVFDDMFNEPVRQELDHWLRYSESEKNQKQDGLAYDCMELSGGLLKFMVKHYRLLRWPVISTLLKQYYLRTMKDKSTVGYLLAPFSSEEESYRIGRYMIDAWIEMTKAGKYLHPFGTIVSNSEAHADFVKLIGLQNETKDSNYVVFIFRAGASPKPVESLRIPYEKHLYVAAYNTEEVKA